jgi:hypothetical protein
MHRFKTLCLLGLIFSAPPGAWAKSFTPSVTNYLEVSGSNCDDKVDIKDEKGKALGTLCPDEFKQCKTQVACFYNTGDEKLLLKYIKDDRFAEIDMGVCPYGYAAKNICLDPYYSISADPAFYKLGDVVYIDAARGVKLPDGSYHTGYFIVRDTDAKLKGEDRFDFFVGANAELDENNPFVKLGFSDAHAKVEYTRINDPAKVDLTLKGRDYPSAIVGTFVFPDSKKTTPLAPVNKTSSPASSGTGSGTQGAH